MRKLVLLVVLMLPYFAETGLSKEVSLQEVKNAGLPILTITTVNGEVPTYERADPPKGCIGLSIKNATKVPARMTISVDGKVVYDSGDYEKDKSGLTIKVRGNTSAYAYKRPFKLKLQKKADLLRRGDKKFNDKDWALIKDEKLRSKMGLKINELLGIQWTPSYEYVNLVFNGEYHGVYMLVETVERNVGCRLNVAETGFVFEFDPYWWNEDKYIPSTLTKTMQYTYKYPDSEKVTEEQQTYMTGLVSQFETSISTGTYTNYIDVNSFAAWMLGHDLLGCNDGAGSNVFLTKYDNSTDTKIMMANLWDFDSALSTKRTEKWDGAHDNKIFGTLFKSTNQTFVRTYKRRWDELKSTLFSQIDEYLTDYANSAECTALTQSLILDSRRWNNTTISVMSEIEYTRQWFASRKDWLEKNIHSLKGYKKLGDVNDDDKADEKDLKAIVSYIMGDIPEDFNEYAADVNGDDKVNVGDVVTFISKYMK